ncbi:MAG: hypothetical protein AUJ51_00580 [Elusimicrobia bacterium CG1_02_56_21]|nr:MAG: hypothetical protein AUJ51_00580 [Elusimicrobia bacterium CG1_02_56_21]
MNKETLKKSYQAAAIAAGGIIGAIVFYTVIVELLRNMGYKPPLQPPAAVAAKYSFYLLGVSVLPILKMTGIRLGEKKETAEETVRALTVLAILRAALCELPAISGLVMFLLTGLRLDFYLLVVFSVGLEVYNFPRLSKWEERIRGDFGQL